MLVGAVLRFRLPRLFLQRLHLTGCWPAAVLGLAWPAALPAADTAFAHPILDHGVLTNPSATSEQRTALAQSLEARAEEVLSLSEAQLLALIPTQTPRILHACPACARRQPRPIPEQPSAFPGNFDPRKPDEITCRDCGTCFPHADYPADHQETLRNLRGEDVSVRYYLDPQGGLTAAEAKAGRQRRYYLDGVIDTARRDWLVPRLNALAQLYQLTHDERYARPVVRALAAYADRYPHYLLTTDYGYRYTTTAGKTPPYGWVDTRWGRRSGDDVPASLLTLFDLVVASPVMDNATRDRIREQLFVEPIRRGELWGRRSLFGNICPLSQMVDRAKVLESPELIHDCYRLIRDFPRFSTGSDGMFVDSPGYAALFRYTFFLGARKLDGYSDPAGYVDRDGTRLDRVYPLKEMEEFYRAVVTVPDRLRLPSGGYVTYNDSSSGFGPTWWTPYGETCRPLEHSESVLFPGLRRAILGDGQGAQQIQVHLGFGENGVNHGHQGTLGLQLYAFGHPLIDDFAYHKSRLRRYAEMTLAHQTVVIDQANQNRTFTEGDVELFSSQAAGFSAIRVDAQRAYAGRAQRYARTLVLNTIDPAAPYVVDVFEVEGGTLHDYHLRGSAQHPPTLALTLPTQPMPGLRPLMAPGETWTEPTVQREGLGTGYGLLFDARHAAATSGFSFTFALRHPWAGPILDPVASSAQRWTSDGAYVADVAAAAGRPPVGSKHHVLLGSGYEVITAGSPSLTETGFTGLNQPSEEWPRLPHLILRHRVAAGERSVFVVVHEPYQGAPRLTTVQRLDSAHADQLALRITIGDRVDTLLYALDGVAELNAGGARLQGRLGLVSAASGRPVRGYLVQGTRLNANGLSLETPVAMYRGHVAAVERRWDGRGSNRLAIEGTTLPLGDALRGTMITLIHGPWSPRAEDRDQPGPAGAVAGATFPRATQTFEIDHVSVENGRTWVYLTMDPGLSQVGQTVHEFYFPGRTFAGSSRFEISPTASTHLKPKPVQETPLELALLPSNAGQGKPGLLVRDYRGKGDISPGLAAARPDVRGEIDAARFGATKERSASRYTGLLRVPREGVYTFHVGATSECRFLIGDTPVIVQQRGQSLMPDVRAVRLKAGYYPVRLDYFYESRDLPPWFSADWSGPSLPRADLATACLTGTPET